MPDPETNRPYFTHPETVLGYARAAMRVGLWESERTLLERFVPKDARVLELGCGAGRVAAGMIRAGWTDVLATDFSAPMIDAARGVAAMLRVEDRMRCEVADATAKAAQVFADLGARVDAVDPGFEDPLEITTGLWFASARVVWESLTPEQQAVTDPDFAAEAELGARIPMLEVQRLGLRRGALGSHMRQFMQRYDLLLTPSVAVPAFAAKPAGHQTLNPETMLGWTPFSYPFNLTQQPAATIPCGLTADGLPIGLQIVGPMFADGLVLRAARAFESVCPIPRPTL